jgi:tyrosyl-tRNA synthetase
MLGRFYQEKNGQAPQVIITTKITPGIDGKAKQSKSLGNYIGLGHSPKDKFGRVMRIPDELILTYFEVYTAVSQDRLDQVAARLDSDPMGCKLLLAQEIVKRYHGEAIAEQEHQAFVDTFSKGKVPKDIPVLPVVPGNQRAFEVVKSFLRELKATKKLSGYSSKGPFH